MFLYKKEKVDLTPVWDAPPKKKKKKVIKQKVIPNKSLFKSYKKQVWQLTEVNCVTLQDISKRGFTSFHIDHKISIDYGFKNNIPVENIAHISNLRMIMYKENMIKGVKCFIDDYNSWIVQHSVLLS